MEGWTFKLKRKVFSVAVESHVEVETIDPIVHTSGHNGVQVPLQTSWF